ncbi:MAG: sulfite exporter TauE/SafE family protein, partial [Candidatus Dormibacteraeota bacterium]|nr:sulfite exporter TauE/SafE family protein [Candidatus Dormibacteraeota bacterium]
DFKLGLTLSIIIGSIPGVLVGSLFSSRAATQYIRAALVVVLLVSGLKLLNVPTAVLGIALAAAIVVAAAYLVVRWRTTTGPVQQAETA